MTYGYLFCSSNCWKPARTAERLHEWCDVSVGGSFPDNSPTQSRDSARESLLSSYNTALLRSI